MRSRACEPQNRLMKVANIMRHEFIHDQRECFALPPETVGSVWTLLTHCHSKEMGGVEHREKLLVGFCSPTLLPSASSYKSSPQNFIIDSFDNISAVY